MPAPPKLSSVRSTNTVKSQLPVDAPATPAPKKANTRNVDGGDFNGGVTAAGLNPLVPAALQKATWDRTLKLAETMAKQGKNPLIVIDHRLTGLDDRPIIRKGFEALVESNDITELKDIDAALKNGTLKFLPGYTEQASDAWREAHPDLVKKYPGAFGSPGGRVPINFMGYSVRDANATAGLAELDAALKLRTGGKGRLVFAGSGTGQLDDFKSVYARPKDQGGGGLTNPDVRFGAPAPSAEANTRASEFASAYEKEHPTDGEVPLDHDSRGKAGWIETLEKEDPNNVVVAFVDDRLHNRVAAQAAGKLGHNMIAIRAVAPGISVAASDTKNENQISTFSPNPT
jgi:hypothetical protein